MAQSEGRTQNVNDGDDVRATARAMEVVVSAIPDEILYGSRLVDRPKVPGQLPRIGNYELHGEIGAGGMGVVFLARDVRARQRDYVALKTIRPELVDTEAAKHFGREIQTLQNLNHTYIVPVLDVSHPSEKPPFIVMPYFSRGSVARLIESSGALPVRDVARFAWQVATAIQHAHDLGVRHGDIKPANLLLTDDGESLCISDFGLARNFASNCDADGILRRSRGGTPQYMSPQMVDGREEAYAADIYSFGATMYEILAGRPPFVSEEKNSDAWRADIHRQIRQGMPTAIAELRPDATHRLIEIIEKAMAHDVEKRYAHIRTAVRDLATAGYGPPRGDSEQLARRTLRRRLLSVAAAIAAVAALVGTWLTIAPAQSGIIETVQVDESRPTVLLTWRHGCNEPEVFHTFPPSAFPVVADTISLRTGGPQAVVAGVARPVEGHNLFLFDREGTELNRWDLSSTRRWRDCGPPTKWKVAAIVTGNLDGEDGDEIAVAASDAFEYPSRITIIDPRTGDVRSTFWHLGQLSGLLIIDDFFGPGHPALVVSGSNNKLDGFNAEGEEHPPRPYPGRPGEDPPRTAYGRVGVLMILDPRDMNGVGPPRVPETQNLEGANPYAYAFLDAPSTQNRYTPDGTFDLEMPQPQQVVAIGCVERVQSEVENHAPWLRICADRRADAPPEAWQSAILQVDRHLALRNVLLADAGTDQTTAEHWYRVWTPVIRNRAYLRD